MDHLNMSQLQVLTNYVSYKYSAHKRIIARAYDLAAQGAIMQHPEQWPELATVASLDGETAYTISATVITMHDGERRPGLECNCKAYQIAPEYINGKPYCKHCLAAMLDRKTTQLEEAEAETEAAQL